MKVRVLIADDEPTARARLRDFLSHEDEVEIVGECAAGGEVVHGIRRERPDLVVLDVQLPEMDGFEVVEEVGPALMPPVIFVTDGADHAVRAFDVNALDYLVKPFGVDRFLRAYRRARTMIEETEPADDPGDGELRALLERLGAEQRELERLLSGAQERYLERLMVKTEGRVLLLRAGEIDWVEAEGNYVRLHAGRQVYLVRETMSALERRLDPRQFVRVHRSTIVNLDRVKELRPWFAGDYQIVLEDATELRLSRGYRAKLEERLS